MESVTTPSAEGAQTPLTSSKIALDALKAARRSAAAPVAGAAATATAAAAPGAATTTETPAAATTTTTTAEVDIDDAALKQFVDLSRENRTLKEKQRDFETKTSVADKFTQAQALAAEGKHYDAIKLLGLDFDAAAKEVLGLPGEKVDPDLKALRDEVAALKAGQTKTQEQIDAEAARVQAEQREQAIPRIVADVTAAADKFPYLSRSPEWVKAALVGADEAYPKLVKKLGRPLNADEKTNLIKAALEEGESLRAREAVLYGAPAKAAAPAAKPATTTFDGSMRGSLGSAASRAKSAATLEELKAQRRSR